MRMIGLLAILGVFFYLMYMWFGEYQTSVSENTDTPVGLEDGIYVPIDNAVNVKNQIETNLSKTFTQ